MLSAYYGEEHPHTHKRRFNYSHRNKRNFNFQKIYGFCCCRLVKKFCFRIRNFFSSIFHSLHLTQLECLSLYVVFKWKIFLLVALFVSPTQNTFNISTWACILLSAKKNVLRRARVAASVFPELSLYIFVAFNIGMLMWNMNHVHASYVYKTIQYK